MPVCYNDLPPNSGRVSDTLPHMRLYADTAVHLPHAIRNAIFPIQMRLDALLLSADANEHVRRAREGVRHLVHTVEGFSLLLEQGERSDDVRTEEWAYPLHALCTALSPSATFRVTTDLPAESLTALRVPRVMIARLIAQLLLMVQQFDVNARTDFVLFETRSTVRLTVHVSMRDPIRVRDVVERVCAACQPLLGRGHTLTHTEQPQQFTVEVALPRWSFEGGHDESECDDATTLPAAVQPFRVLCIDDNTSLVDALEARLSQVEGFAGLAHATTIAAGLTALTAHLPNLVLLDVHLGDAMDTLAAIALFRTHVPTAHIALISGSRNDALIRKAMNAGASGFVLKGVAPTHLIDTIIRLARGEKILLLDDA